jgi:uncharacterized protein
MKSIFLKAEWRKLAMANYAIDKSVLQKYLPFATELDLWNDTCYVSLVGFIFLNTRLKGFRIPFHGNFEEVNLRFYVRHRDNNEWKRGVVFVKEIVPRAAITFVANSVYNENYETMRMEHFWESDSNEEFLDVAYRWKKKHWNSFRVRADKDSFEINHGSEEEFITEHFWGYTRINDGTTSEYGVEHPRWKVYPVREYSIDVDFQQVYGDDFAFLKAQKPVSVFLAEGSEIVVRSGTIIK